ncbi:hypothetical protein EUTSA_v10009237mg [Eutrema salsugineum]|uniref:CHCH domain-containing protein n=1 Tax=Eutrema salsugineum TaxID=72664 RepID=V4KZQ4_EUTSA|nr:hypothetical protein EUTSA_v10009237mg [Eutrema salsugineum]
MATKGTAAAAYPSAARISDSPCYLQYSASLKCLEEFGSDKSKCQDHFDVYKECKKKEVSCEFHILVARVSTFSAYICIYIF